MLVRRINEALVPRPTRGGRRAASYKPDHSVVLAFGSTMLRSRIVSFLQLFYEVRAFADGPAAIAACRSHPPSVVLVGEELRPSNGFDFVRLMRMDPALKSAHVIMLVGKDDKPTRDSVGQCGAQSHVLSACSRNALLMAVAGVVNLAVERSWAGLPEPQRQALTSSVALFNQISDVIGKGEPIPFAAAKDACKPLIEAVNNNGFKGILLGVRDHDDYSYAHSLRVATLLAMFGFNLGLSQAEQAILASGGLLHDVGKILIPREVLNKPGRLTDAEFEVMRGHVDASLSYLQGCPGLPNGILTIAGQHHERLDGSGYPRGLAGNQLDELARMASIIDVFSALTDRRVYKAPMDAEAALKVMVEEMGPHLDMARLRLFREMLLDVTRDTIAA